MRPRRRPNSGFTLAEVAVTIVIVGIGMLLVLQGLNTAKMTAAHTRNFKLARELALLTLGQIASGQYQEDIENGLVGSYAEEGYPDFSFEVIVGDQAFTEQDEYGVFDSWKAARDRREEELRDEENPEEREEPFEKVKIRITFPQIRVGEQNMKNELVLEQWIPWTQVYGETEEDGDVSGTPSTTGGAGGGGSTTGGR